MRPQDIVILLEIIATFYKSNIGWPDSSLMMIPQHPTNKAIALSLKISEAEVSESLRRSAYAGLLDDPKYKRINKKALLDFLLCGLKYVFPVQPGALSRGVPTAHSAPPLEDVIMSDEKYVWKFAEGKVRGQLIEPLYPTVPEVVANDSELYKLLTLTDAIRIGSARVVRLASEELEKRIMSAW
ncbi:hypothetical protein [Persicitalea sp.]|uniref:hypothetical protein n=1 Tax=Persicitalea sp. TaxID=3100273 RepID=UPI0035948F09